MTKLIAIVTHRYVLWGLLSLPALPMLFSIVAQGHVPPQFQTGSGEWAMRFLLLTLALTPLQRLFRKSRFVHAFVRRRRDIGLASFFYALLHVGFFLFETVLSWGTWRLDLASVLGLQHLCPGRLAGADPVRAAGADLERVVAALARSLLEDSATHYLCRGSGGGTALAPAGQ